MQSPVIIVSKTPISMLQERCTQFGITPCYDLIANEGTVHEPVFIYACTAGGYTGTGRGPSKKKAKHNAAKAVLEVIDGGRYTFLTDENEEDEAATTVQGGGQHPVTQLQEECQRRSLRPPEYVFEVKHPGPQQTFVCNCNVAEFTEVSIGRSKKIAKRRAASSMLDRLQSRGEANGASGSVGISFRGASAKNYKASATGLDVDGSDDSDDSEFDADEDVCTNPLAARRAFLSEFLSGKYGFTLDASTTVSQAIRNINTRLAMLRAANDLDGAPGECADEEAGGVDKNGLPSAAYVTGARLSSAITRELKERLKQLHCMPNNAKSKKLVRLTRLVRSRIVQLDALRREQEGVAEGDETTEKAEADDTQNDRVAATEDRFIRFATALASDGNLAERFEKEAATDGLTVRWRELRTASPTDPHAAFVSLENSRPQIVQFGKGLTPQEARVDACRRALLAIYKLHVCNKLER